MKFQFGASKCIFGRDSSREISGYAAQRGCSRLLCVCDEGVKKAGLVAPVIAALEEKGLSITVFDRVLPDPAIEIAEEAAQMARDCGAEGVLAIGGGSSLDTAKLAAVLAGGQIPLREVLKGQEISHDPLVLIAVPTTSGTGSEVTPAAVVTDLENNRKVTLVNDKLRPACAVLDPALTLGLPKGITAATGMDALAHAMESMTCILHNPISDGLALQAMRLLKEYLPRCVEDGTDLDARSQVMIAATIAGMAFGNTAAHAGHGMAHAMGANWHIPHGMACAISLPFAIRLCEPAMGGQLQQMAAALGLDGAGEGAAAALSRWVVSFRDSLGMPSLSGLKVDESLLEQVAQACMKERMLQLSGVPVTVEMCRDYLRNMLSE